ncbi:hypothetical protein [Beijerinckia sp. L45]|uniref:hypothetical protein n=1 Tax=Beijerinckia sp. L45 TaxID=1641855 RepID=UPI00131BDFA6|nr:hypothetical protein [Beijerinckia sp. L45]
MGLFQAEKSARNVDNSAFNQVDKAQSGAAQAAIVSGQQPGADVFRPGQMIRQRMDAIDAASAEAQDRLAAAHQDAVTQRQMATQAYADQQREGLAERTVARGQASGDAKADADAVRQAQHDQLVAAFQDAHDQAIQAATDAAAPLQTRTNAEDLGSTLRAAEEEVRGTTKQAHKDLYDVVDPDGTLALVATPVRDKALQVAADLKRDGSDFDPAEAPLFRRAASLPEVIPYRMLHTLDKDLGAAMSKERRGAGETSAWARLTQLKGSIKDAMIKAADNQVQHETRMVDAGLMPSEDTLEARMREKWNVNQDASRANASGSLAGTGTDTLGMAGGGAPTRAGGVRTAGPAGGGARQTPGDQGIPAPALQPNFDPAATNRLKAANAAYANYAKIYKNPTIGPGLRTTGYGGQYQISDAAFIKRAVVAGDRGYEIAKAHLAAAKNDSVAISAIQDAALAPLRKNVPPFGNLHPDALAKWKEAYGPALRAVDEVSPGFSDRFDSAANATQALLDVGAQQKQALADFQRNAARQAVIENAARREQLGQATAADRAQVSSLLAERAADDRAAIAQSKAETSQGIAQARGIARDAHATPAGQFLGQGGDRIAVPEVENAVGSMLTTGTQGATRMRSFVGSLDPDSLAGVRKAGTDWMVRTFQNANGDMSGAKFINFVRDNKEVLKELYPSSQVSMFGAVADKLRADAMWRTETAIKGGSDSAKNLLAHLAEHQKSTGKHTSMAFIAAEAMREGYDHGGWQGGAAAGAGAATLYLMNSLRSAGIKSVAQLYQTMLADPEKARFMISKMPDKPEGGVLRALTGSLRRSLIVGQEQSKFRN